MRILITAFGPFPGAPYNPTPALLDRLVRLRRPAFTDVVRIGHVFDVTYDAVDRELPHLIAQHRADALLLFGLAARTPFVRVETRARNAVTRLWPDAAQATSRRGVIAGRDDDRRFPPLTLRLQRAAAATGIDARLSRDAGRYLCNYLCWRALEACDAADGPGVAAFVHVPLIARDGTSLRPGGISLDMLTDAGEAMLFETVRSARAARLLPRH